MSIGQCLRAVKCPPIILPFLHFLVQHFNKASFHKIVICRH
eukprot:CCRYP_012589-RA/>CCRYP_012589-RA protein AED:0.33 eAED:0.33 QI:97/1/1/1/0/0/2/43/40